MKNNKIIYINKDRIVNHIIDKIVYHNILGKEEEVDKKYLIKFL